MVNVLFVCSGNHCRSPMAEAWFQHLCRQAGVSEEVVAVGSAGTGAMHGSPANASVVAVLAAEGIDIAAFRGRQINDRLVEEATLIVVMAQSQREYIAWLWPEAEDRLVNLLDFVGEEDDVPDPLGGTEADFATCLQNMKPALTALLSHLHSHYLGKGHDSP